MYVNKNKEQLRGVGALVQYFDIVTCYLHSWFKPTKLRAQNLDRS